MRDRRSWRSSRRAGTIVARRRSDEAGAPVKRASDARRSDAHAPGNESNADVGE
jgi:hypothetical protein